MTQRLTAGDRLKRVLAVIPWIVANPGSEIAVVAARFGLTDEELINDLNVVWMVGLPPYTPDALVEVRMEEGRVWIDYADFFARPLRLSPDQGLALLASTDGLLSVPGTDREGPLARALTKLSDSLGFEPDEAVDVDLGGAEPEVLSQLRTAASAGTEVEISYYSYGRDERTERRIAPWRVWSDGGEWYVEAWCHLADGERVFRVDRIETLVETRSISEHPPPDTSGGIFNPTRGAASVTLDVSPAVAWVIETYPSEELPTARTDGWRRVRLVVTAVPWLERLLLRLGPDAVVVEQTGLPDVVGLGQDAAARVLSRYGE